SFHVLENLVAELAGKLAPGLAGVFLHVLAQKPNVGLTAGRDAAVAGRRIRDRRSGLLLGQLLSGLLQGLGRLVHGVLRGALLSLIELVLSLFHLALSLLQSLAGLLLLSNIGGRRLAHLLRGLFHLLRGPVQR